MPAPAPIQSRHDCLFGVDERGQRHNSDGLAATSVATARRLLIAICRS
jgi:hypothetical protein